MRAALLVLLACGPAAAQEVADCDPAPPVTALVEPWEDTSASLGGGAIRLALLHGEAEGVALLALTLPPVEADADAEAPADPAAPPPPPRCRVVSEGGIGFAALDLAALAATEDPAAATLTARVPALRFVPESTELEEVVLALTFGVADDSLLAAIETAGGDGSEGGGGP